MSNKTKLAVSSALLALPIMAGSVIHNSSGGGAVYSFFGHGRTMQAGPGPYVHLQLRSYFWCRSQQNNPLHEPCDNPLAGGNLITNSIHLVARVEKQCSTSCLTMKIVSSNDPLVYPPGKPLVMRVSSQYQGVLVVTIYTHLQVSYNSDASTSISLINAMSRLITFCSTSYFSAHVNAYLDDHLPCGP